MWDENFFFAVENTGSVIYYVSLIVVLYLIFDWYFGYANEGGYFYTRHTKHNFPNFVVELNETLPPHYPCESLVSQCSTVLELFYKRVKLNARKAAWYEKDHQKRWMKITYGEWYELTNRSF